MRALTKDLGRLVYHVETDLLQPSTARRSGANGGFRRNAQSVPPGALDQSTSSTQLTRTLSSDDELDGAEQTTLPPLQQQQLARISAADLARVARQPTSSDDSLTYTTIPPSSTVNRV